MASLAITSKSEGLHQICRLCLSEESLHGVWEKEDLQQWISDYLSITVAAGDLMSQSICTICQIRITEFHHFRVSCQEVQNVLQSMMEDVDIKREEVGLASAAQDQRPEKLESVMGRLPDSEHSDGVANSFERDANNYYEEMEDDQLEDQFVVQDVKVEPRADEDLESLSQDSNQVNAEKDGATEDQPLLQCETCNSSFSSTKELWDHKKAAHGENAYKCSVCRVEFKFRSVLFLHFKSEQHLKNVRQEWSEPDGTVKFKCDICKRVYDSRARFNQHRKQSHGPKPTCDICGGQYSSRTYLQRHIQSHHPDGLEEAPQDMDDAQRPFKCEQCRKAFPTRKQLNAHERYVHGAKIFECSLCDYKCSYIHSLNRHMTRHSKQQKTASP